MPIIKRPNSSNAPSDDRDQDGPNRYRKPSDKPVGRPLIVSMLLWFFGLIAFAVIVGALIVGYALIVMGPSARPSPFRPTQRSHRPKG